MKIGEVAAQAGVPTATVRYYERRGLIAPAERTKSGYRQYDHEAVRRLRFIRHAQQLGYSLDEIREMLELRVEDSVACARVEARTQEKIRSVQQRLAELQRLEQTLQELVGACARHEATEPCPILLVLEESDDVRYAGSGRAHAYA